MKTVDTRYFRQCRCVGFLWRWLSPPDILTSRIQRFAPRRRFNALSYRSLAAYLETASACGKSDDNVHEKRTVFPGQFPLRHFLLPCSVRVRVRSGVSRATVRVSGVRVSRVSSRVKVRVVVRFMVWVSEKCLGGEMCVTHILVGPISRLLARNVATFTNME